ncbi:MAG: ATP-binding protein [Rhodocyclaceae bacterium]|nr:ATP-binding protein [Rhodocyclaceae bacterium]
MPVLPDISFVDRRRWVFLGVLVALHLVFLQGPHAPLGKVLFLSHIGLGLLWQPFVQAKRRLGLGGTIAVLICAGLAAWFLNWGLLAIWTMLLAGVVGGKVFLFPDRGERLFHLLALGYLTTAVLALILPQTLVAADAADPLIADLVRYLVPLVFLLMALLPIGREAQQRTEVVDFIYGVFVFLLLGVIVLGSISFSFLFRAGYLEALMVTLGLVAGLLLLLGWIWNPHAGFGGLGSAVAQHVMSLGLPIEEWLDSLAELAEREADPERFLALACAALPRRMPGVVGGDWQTAGGPQTFADQQGHRVGFRHGRLTLGLVCRFKPSPSLLWHYDLAARLLAEFHLGIWRAQELQRLSYVAAIHETGARVTHDVKNLLQSLDTLCAAAQQENEASPRLMGLMRRQLPEISSRLRQTLTKLAAPVGQTQGQPMAALPWFASLESRYANAQTVFSIVGDMTSLSVPDAQLFSCVAENLLQNLANKQAAHAATTAAVRLGEASGRVWFEVADNGPAVPDEVSDALFERPVSSDHGLGIGLYQCARLARQAGYRLTLAENRDGGVCFRLAAAD